MLGQKLLEDSARPVSSVKYYSERPQNVLKVFVKDLPLNVVTYERLGAQTFEMTHGRLGVKKIR